MESEVGLEQLVSLAKRRGFIFQGSEIYGGLAGTWDYGPLGVQLKRNLQSAWWDMFVESRDDMYGIDSAILMNPKVWQASGHTGAGFADPIVIDTKTNERFRADHLLEDAGVANPEAMTIAEMDEYIKTHGIKSPAGNELSTVSLFNMMFKTHVGSQSITMESEDFSGLEVEAKLYHTTKNKLPTTDDAYSTVRQPKTTELDSMMLYNRASASYLRPETAQGMFVNFKNIVDSMQPDLPFGIAQIGKTFRNEISPREFIFRVREFEIMEFEYFIPEDEWEATFEHFREQFYLWCERIGLSRSKIHELEVPAEDRAHYSKRTIDFEYAFDFGTKEIGAIAYRTDFDLSNHAEHSGVNMLYRPKDGAKAFVPHVIEPTFGSDRFILAVLSEAYTVDPEHDRVYLALPADLAPVKICVGPLKKNNPELVAKAREVYRYLQSKHGRVVWDDNANIGKRYKRQDEIGTPRCITIDFDTLKDDTVTIRDRDTTDQQRADFRSL